MANGIFIKIPFKMKPISESIMVLKISPCIYVPIYSFYHFLQLIYYFSLSKYSDIHLRPKIKIPKIFFPPMLLFHMSSLYRQ